MRSRAIEPAIWRVTACCLAVAILSTIPRQVESQRGGGSLTLAAALAEARRVSPELRALREATTAAAARERQASAYPNPSLVFGREQTSGAGQSNSQNILMLEQRIDVSGQRGARREAARLLREAAAARLALAEAQLDFEVTRAYATALAADRRATLAEVATRAFDRALAVTGQRLVAGDVSGYANRRIRLEAARYGTVRAEAVLARQTARLTLASLISPAAPAASDPEIALVDEPSSALPPIAVDSLRALAMRARAEIRVADLEAAASAAEARATARERIPVPAVAAGAKVERVAGTPTTMSGLSLGLTVPLPLWDRRQGAVAAAEGEARRKIAEVDAVRRRVGREVVEAYESLRSVQSQLEMLAPQLGAESEAALRAAQVAYSEGEVPLVEWLDAVRAYQEAEASLAGIRAEAAIRRAALERVVGTSLGPVTASPSTHDAARLSVREER